MPHTELFVIEVPLSAPRSARGKALLLRLVSDLGRAPISELREVLHTGRHRPAVGGGHQHRSVGGTHDDPIGLDFPAFDWQGRIKQSFLHRWVASIAAAGKKRRTRL